MESLRPEVEPFGIHTTIVNPGFFRTELLTPESTDLRRDGDRRLRRAPRCAGRVLDQPGRQAVGPPGEAGPGPADGRERGAAAAAVHRRRRLDRLDRAEGRRPAGRHRPQPRALHLARLRGRMTMRAAIFTGPSPSRRRRRPDAALTEPTDAIVRVTLACVCGSDLWYYRGLSPHDLGAIGHEFIGIVEEVGADVRDCAPATSWSRRSPSATARASLCRAGWPSNCLHGGGYRQPRHGRRQARPSACLRRATLVKVPGAGHSDETLRSILALSDVACTGHHAAVSGGVGPGMTVAVVGDGAVGLFARACGEAARRRADHRADPESGPPAGRPRVRGNRHRRRARRRGDRRRPPHDGRPRRRSRPRVCWHWRLDGDGLRDRSGGLGRRRGRGTARRRRADRHGDLPKRRPARRRCPGPQYVPELLPDVLAGRINPGRVLDYETDLDHIRDAYDAMDERRAIKALVRVAAGLGQEMDPTDLAHHRGEQRLWALELGEQLP